MSWPEWITDRYLKWRMDKPGRAGSAASYAREIGFDPQTLSSWMNRGSTPRDSKTIQKQITYFGPEVCDVLGVPRPQDLPFDKLPSDLGATLQAAMFEIANELNARSIDPESPEAEEISRAILSKYGLIVRSISRSG